jgi:dihydrofolate reductase
MSKPLVSAVFAVAKNGVIGRNGDLPWHVPTDLAFFKRVTLGKPMIMGRRTFESLPGLLPNRTSIVVSSGQPDLPEGVILCASIEQALSVAQTFCSADQNEIIIAGGSQIYASALPFTDRLIVTHIDAEPEGDTVLDCIDWSEWVSVRAEHPEQSEKDQYVCHFVTYERIRAQRDA